MFSLTVDPDAEGQVHHFQVSAITIGSGTSGEAHLEMGSEEQPLPLIKVEAKNGQFSVTCSESSPLVTFNDQPFTDTVIQHGDALKIGSRDVLLELDMPEEDQPDAAVQISEEEMDMLLGALDEDSPPVPTDNTGQEGDSEEPNPEPEGEAESPSEPQPAPEPVAEVPADSNDSSLDLEAELARLGEMLSDGMDSVLDDELDDLDIDRLLQEAEEESEQDDIATESPEVAQEAAPAGVPADKSPDAQVEPAEADSEETDEKAESVEEGEEKPKPKEPVTLEFNEEEADEFLLELPDNLMDEVIRAEDPEGSQSVIPRSAAGVDEVKEGEGGVAGNSEVPVAIIEEAEEEEEFDFFDEEDFEDEEDSEEELIRQRHQRTLMMTGGVLLVSVLLGIIAYFSVASSNTQQETLAVRGIADVSVSLVHAQLNDRIPFNMNFKDPEFLSEEMAGVLSNEYRKRSPVNEHGEFKQADYELEIFSTSDLSRFLVLALPRSGLIQKLIPKSTFVVDSETLRVHRIGYIEPWLALLKGGHSLDFVNAQDIRQQISLEQTIRLASLDTGHSEEGFQVPESLSVLNPTAENLIYTSPRYHRLSKALVDQVKLVLGETMRSEITIQGLHERIRELSNLKHLVVYVQGGEQEALEIQEGLRVFGLGRPFLVGYLSTDPQTSLISNCGLLETAPVKPAPLADLEPHVAQPNISDDDPQVKMADLAGKPSSPTDQALHAHPLYQQIHKLVADRKLAQEATSREIMEMLAKADSEDPGVREERQQQLIELYESAKEKQDAKLTEELNRVFNEEVVPHWNTHHHIYKTLLAEFGITALAPPHTDLVKPTPDYTPEGDTEALLEEIPQTKSLEELNVLVTKAKALIHKAYRDDPTENVTQQNRLRSLVLRRIGDFILNPTSEMFVEQFQSHNRYLMDKILNDANVTDDEERAFFLQEFDMLVKRLQTLRTNPRLQELRENEVVYSDKLQSTAVGGSATRQELLEKSFQNKVALEEREESIQQLEEQIGRIPLETPNMSGSEASKQDLGRLGQQILIQQRPRPPSSERDDKLVDAIGLLVQATDIQRTFWQDILEIRRMLTETPEAMLTQAMESEVGFGPMPQPLPIRTKALLKDYIQSKQALANQRNSDQFKVHYQLFAKKYRPILERILQYSRTIESESNRLRKATDLYLERLNQFLKDYDTAKRQGFFVAGRLHHSIQIHRLRAKVRLAEEVRSRIVNLTGEMVQAGQAFQALAKDETEQLDMRGAVTRHTVTTLQQRANSILFPNLVGENLDQMVKDVTSRPISPVP